MIRATRKIAIRVDASLEIGTGHFMRCLTLADALSKDGCILHFVCRHLLDHLRQSIIDRGYKLTLLDREIDSPIQYDLQYAHWLGVPQHQDAIETFEALKNECWDWLIVDHYALDFRWEQEFRQLAQKILVIDDLADRQHDCDVLVDQNLYEDMEFRYRGKIPDHCKCLIGPRYALLRDEFRIQHNAAQIRAGRLNRVLLFFGGIDAKNFTQKAMQALKRANLPNLIVDVVIGANHPVRSRIELECQRFGYQCHVQTSRMAELMLLADLSIGAGGITCWERAALGLPTIALCTADNQVHQLRSAAKNGLLYLPDDIAGDVKKLAEHFAVIADNSILRESISARALAMVDGKGILRLLNFITHNDIQIRPVEAADSALLYEWRNHPQIRITARTQQIIDWETHQTWLTGILTNPQRVLLLGLRHEQSIGVVRFDLQEEIAEISIYLAPDLVSDGLGYGLLLAAETWLWKEYPLIKKINAFVLGKNSRSRKFFKGADYELTSATYAKVRKK